MIKVITSILIISILNSGLIEKIKTDETLIVPGVGAEKVVMTGWCGAVSPELRVGDTVLGGAGYFSKYA